MNAPHTVKRRRLKIDGVFDIECANWTDFVCGGYLRTADNAFFLYSNHVSADPSNDAQAMATALFCNGGTVWAHSGGTYDFKWLLDIAARRGYYVGISSAGARIVTAQIGKLSLRDSWALCPIKLEDLTQSQGVSKQKLDLPCNCGKDCGGYCSISRTMPLDQYKRLCEYLEADCRSLYEALLKLQDFADENDIDLSATVGSSAWRTIRRWLGVPNASMDAAEHAFVRRAYYGGRVLNALPGERFHFNEFDVSGMYPWAMKTVPMPVGDYRIRYNEDARDCLMRGVAGVYDVLVDVPPMHLPPLPYRTPHRAAYPTGKFRGTWALPELAFAITLGVKVCEVIQAITWNKTEVVFTHFVDEIFRLRSKAGKKTPMGTFLKFLMNAPYGKLGSSPDKERFFINPRTIVKCPGTEPCRYDGLKDCGKCCDHHCTRKCGAMAEHSDYVWSQYAYHLDECAHIEMAAYITSSARVEWLTQALSKNEGMNVIYGDTDSLQTFDTLTRKIGSDCGEWEFKGASRRGVFIAPKTYFLEREEVCSKCKKRHLVQARSKGLGAPCDAPIIVGKVYPSRGVVGLKMGARLGELFTANDKVTDGRKAQYSTGDRLLLPDGTTRAPTIEEITDAC